MGSKFKLQKMGPWQRSNLYSPSKSHVGILFNPLFLPYLSFKSGTSVEDSKILVPFFILPSCEEILGGNADKPHFMFYHHSKACGC